jgi:hypothetical protein
MRRAPAPCSDLLRFLLLLTLLLLCRLSQLGLWRQWDHTMLSLAQW